MPTLTELTNKRLLKKPVSGLGSDLGIQLNDKTKTSTMSVAPQDIKYGEENGGISKTSTASAVPQHINQLQDTIDILEGVQEYPLQIGKTVLEMAKGTQEMIARSGASVALTLAGKNIFEPNKELSSKLDKLVYKTIFGEGSLKSVEQRIAETEITLKQKGLELPGFGKINVAGKELPLAFLGVGATIGLDFTGWGAGKSGIIKLLTKTEKVEEVAKILKGINVAEDLVSDYAPVIAKMSKADEVSKALSHIEKLQTTTKVSSKIVPEATKLGVSAEKGVIPQIIKPLTDTMAKYDTLEGFKNNFITELKNPTIKKANQSYLRGSSVFTGVMPKGKIRDFVQENNIKGYEDLFNYVKGIKTTEITPLSLQPLAQEARKYKSAEDVYDALGFTEGAKETIIPIKTNGKVVGGIDASVKRDYPDTLQVHYVRILPESQGKGIGTEAVAKLFKDNPKIKILEGHATAESKSFWQKQGATFSGSDNNIFTIKRSQLTDFYNQAVKGVKEVKPVVKSITETAPRTLPKQVGKETVEQLFQVEKLNLDPSQISNIEKRLEVLGLKERTVRTFDDVKRAAQELGVDTRKILSETARIGITDKEVVALKNTINTKAQDIVRLEQQLIANPRDTQILNIKLAQANQEIDLALKKLIKGGTESGRAVSAFRILAEHTLEPAFWLKKAQTVAGGRKLSIDEVSAITDLVAKGDRQGLANFVSMLRNPSFGEMAITLWKAGLLTSPTTHLANIGGNLTMAGLMTASDVFSTGFDILASLVTGKRSTTIGLSTIGAKVKGFIGGTKAAGTYLKEGVYSADVLKKWDMPRQTIFKNKVLNGYIQGVFRSLGAEDILFRKAAMSEAFQKGAIITAKNEKLVGSAFKARVRELLSNPTNEMVMDAIDTAEYATFQNPNALANFISAGRKAGGEGLRATTEFIAPFTLTPTNVAMRIADFTPAGFVKAIIQAINPATRNQKAIVESLGRATTGTGIMALGALLASKGLMTGNVPENANEKAMFYAEGKQANSIRIGDRWFQLNRISPIGNLMSLGAEFYQLSKEREGLQLAGATILAGIKGLTEQTFLQGISSALQVINEPERQLENYVERAVSGMIPSIIGRTARTIDPKLRIPDTLWEAIEAKIPGMTENVAPRRDIFGNIAKVPGGKFNLIDPFATMEAIDDPVINEAKKIGAVIGMPSQTISGVKMNQHEYSIYQKVQGKLLHKMLLGLIDSPDYKDLNITDKEKAFLSYTTSVREQLNDLLFPALMIERYGLSKDTQPQILRDILNELNQIDKFKKMTEKKQAEVINKLLLKYQEK